MCPQGWQVFDREGRRKYTTDAERQRFLAAIPPYPQERHAFCVTLVYSGARISEQLALGPGHVEPGMLRFRTLKRRKVHYRMVPVPRFVTDLLLSLPLAAGQKLFWPVNRSTAYRWVIDVMERAGIEGPQASPKGFRHGFGIRALARGVPQNLAQRWLGHARPETTAIYLDAQGPEERAFAERMW